MGDLLKEYIFMTPSGYRHFFVKGMDLNEAENNFMSLDEISRCGFSLDDLPIRLLFKPEMKNFKLDDFWNYNDNNLSK